LDATMMTDADITAGQLAALGAPPPDWAALRAPPPPGTYAELCRALVELVRKEAKLPADRWAGPLSYSDLVYAAMDSSIPPLPDCPPASPEHLTRWLALSAEQRDAEHDKFELLPDAEQTVMLDRFDAECERRLNEEETQQQQQHARQLVLADQQTTHRALALKQAPDFAIMMDRMRDALDAIGENQ
jgi:hypothetical protein